MFIQYDPNTGQILATIIGSTAPIHDNQIEVENTISLSRKRVNVETLELEEIPEETEE